MLLMRSLGAPHLAAPRVWTYWAGMPSLCGRRFGPPFLGPNLHPAPLVLTCVIPAPQRPPPPVPACPRLAPPPPAAAAATVNNSQYRNRQPGQETTGRSACCHLLDGRPPWHGPCWSQESWLDARMRRRQKGRRCRRPPAWPAVIAPPVCPRSVLWVLACNCALTCGSRPSSASCWRLAQVRGSDWRGCHCCRPACQRAGPSLAARVAAGEGAGWERGGAALASPSVGWCSGFGRLRGLQRLLLKAWNAAPTATTAVLATQPPRGAGGRERRCAKGPATSQQFPPRLTPWPAAAASATYNYSNKCGGSYKCTNPCHGGKPSGCARPCGDCTACPKPADPCAFWPVSTYASPWAMSAPPPLARR